MDVNCPLCLGKFRPPVGESGPWECPHCHGSVRETVGPPTSKPAAPNRFAAVKLTRQCKVCGERYPAEEEVCTECGGLSPAAAEAHERRAARAEQGFRPEHAAVNAGVVGGVVLIVVAVVWFVAGLQAGYFFFYPPGLAVIGLLAIANGLWREKPLRRPDASRARRKR